jgi:hypothetical protein
LSHRTETPPFDRDRQPDATKAVRLGPETVKPALPQGTPRSRRRSTGNHLSSMANQEDAIWRHDRVARSGNRLTCADEVWLPSLPARSPLRLRNWSLASGSWSRIAIASGEVGHGDGRLGGTIRAVALGIRPPGSKRPAAPACGAHRQPVWIRRGGSMRRPGGRSSTRSHLMTYDLAVGTEAAENRLERQIRTRPRRGAPRGALREHSSEPRRYRSALEGDRHRARGRRCRGFRARAVSQGGSRSRRQTGWRLRW